MIETILLAFLVAKLKHFKLKPLFKQWAIYPILVCAAGYVYLESMVWHGDYSLIKYSTYFKAIYLTFFIILAFRNKQYKALTFGFPLVWIGYALNIIAVRANGGKMPVYPSLTYFTGYATPETFTNAAKYGDFHVLGNAYTHLIPICDIWDIGYMCFSIGDVLIRSLAFIVIYSTIKYLNTTKNNI